MNKNYRNNNSQSNSFDPMMMVILCGLLIFMGVIFWSHFHTSILKINIYIRYIMGYPLFWVSQFFKDIPILSYPYNYIITYCAPDSDLFGICRRDMSKFNLNDLVELSRPWNIFFGGVLLGILLKDYINILNKHPQAKFSRVHDFKSFLQEQQQNYHHLKIFTKLDLIKEQINHPIFGMSLTSKQFIGLYALTRENYKSDWKELNDGGFLPIINQELLQNVLVKQLGSIWQGWQKLSDTELIIFAALLPLVAATDLNMSDKEFEKAKKDSLDVRHSAWKLFDNDGPEKNLSHESIFLDDDEKRCLWLLEPDIDRANYYPYIEKYRINSIVRQIISKHAFVRTIIFDLLIHARVIGVLEPADFRWLRFCDRSLWYVIESVGRNRPFAEAAAVYDHFNYEILCKTPIYYPYIKNAIVGFNEEVTTFKFKSRNLLLDDYSIWPKWRHATLQKLYPGLDIKRAMDNIKNK